MDYDSQNIYGNYDGTYSYQCWCGWYCPVHYFTANDVQLMVNKHWTSIHPDAALKPAPWYAPLTPDERHELYRQLANGYTAARKLSDHDWELTSFPTPIHYTANEIFDTWSDLMEPV